MTPAGLAAYAARTAAKMGRASYEQRPTAFPAAYAKTFKANKAAWAGYEAGAVVQRTTIWYVVSAVKPETQARRLATLIAASAEQRRIIGPTGKVESAPK